MATSIFRQYNDGFTSSYFTSAALNIASARHRQSDESTTALSAQGGLSFSHGGVRARNWIVQTLETRPATRRRFRVSASYQRVPRQERRSAQMGYAVHWERRTRWRPRVLTFGERRGRADSQYPADGGTARPRPAVSCQIWHTFLVTVALARHGSQRSPVRGNSASAQFEKGFEGVQKRK